MIVTPLVSVIIPTANRPQFLPRAVESALVGMPPGEVEVIVVPNGPDESWKQSLRRFSRKPYVRVIPIADGNANLARNAGIAAARGKYIRFLDDDDYLYPDVAVEQYRILGDSGSDIVSGAVDLVDASGKRLRTWSQPDIEDFCVGVLGPWRVCQPTAHVFRLNTARSTPWTPSVPLRQDIHWLLELCVERDWLWTRVPIAVGAWVQHGAARLSLATFRADVPSFAIPTLYRDRDKFTADLLISIYSRLLSEKRLTDERRHALALGLWDCVHGSFFLDSAYWSAIAKIATTLEPDSRPVQPIYQWPLLRQVPPLLIQWLMLPKRKLTYSISYWRKRRLAVVV